MTERRPKREIADEALDVRRAVNANQVCIDWARNRMAELTLELEQVRAVEEAELIVRFGL